MMSANRSFTALAASLSMLFLSAPLGAARGEGQRAAGTAALPAPAPTAVAEAAMRGDGAAVRALIAKGADVNGAQGDGMTALHWAAERGDGDLATALLAAGAKPAAVTRLGGYMPLHLAARGGHAAVVSALVAARAPVDAATTTGALPLHFAAGAGTTAALTALLDAGAAVDAREAQWGQTPLMFAAAAGRTEAARLLVARGADLRIAAKVVDVSARNKADSAESRARNQRVAALQRERAAQLATIAGTAGAAPSAPRAPRPSADDGGEPEPVGYADLVGSHGGLTALLLAVRDGHQDTTLALARRRRRPESGERRRSHQPAADGHDQRPLRPGRRPARARRRRHPGQRRRGHAALRRAQHAVGAQGATSAAGPLHAAGHRLPRSGRALLKAGADVNARLTKTLWYTTYNRDLLGVDRTGATPFWLAAYTLDLPAMKLLLAHGADPEIRTAKVPERYEEGGPDPSLPDHSGLAPIPWHGPAVAAIHAASGVGYGLGFAGNTHRHVPDGWVPAVRFLVEELNADVNARDHNGYTPLHHAAARGDVDLIKYLVSKGADVKAVARTGQTTVDMANGPVQRVQPYPEAIELLESLGAVNRHRCVSC